jgi:hypothetical protein
MKLRYRTYLPYKTVAGALKEGNDVFFTDLKRQTAHKAAKKLSMMVRETVIAVPAASEKNGSVGYGFITEKRLKEQLKKESKVAGRGL